MHKAVNQLVDYLNARPLLNAVGILSYFLFILFMHHPLVLLSVAIERVLSLQYYNLTVAIFFVLLVIILILVFHFLLKNIDGDRNRIYFYGLATLVLGASHAQFMLDSNVEIIHSLEFTILALLIFPMVKRFGAAIIFTLPFMLLDEWYQYAVLYPDLIDYFDFNDVLMDTYGCGVMMLVLMASGVKQNGPVPEWWKREEFFALVVMGIAVYVSVQFGFVSLYASDVAWLVLNEGSGLEPFWRLHEAHQIYYHVMRPVEALCAIGLLHLFYLGLDKKS